MDQKIFFTVNGTDPESGLASSLTVDDNDPASAIALAIRTFGPGQFQLASGDGRNWRVHVAHDHSWWLEPFSHL